MIHTAIFAGQPIELGRSHRRDEGSSSSSKIKVIMVVVVVMVVVVGCRFASGLSKLLVDDQVVSLAHFSVARSARAPLWVWQEATNT